MDKQVRCQMVSETFIYKGAFYIRLTSVPRPPLLDIKCSAKTLCSVTILFFYKGK